MIIPLGPFEPDRASYAPNVSPIAINALPVKDGWGPMPGISILTQALPQECKGAIYVRQSTGAFRIFAGTTDGLFELDPTDYSWTNISGPSIYAVPQGDLWAFEVFGPHLFAANLGTATQYINIDVGSAFDDAPGNQPRCKFMTTAGEYLVLAHLADYPMRVMTSAIGDASFWTVGERGCDFQDFPDGEEIQGIFGSELGAVVFQRSKIRQITITAGGDYSFTTQVLNPYRGAISSRSITQIGPGQFFFYSTDGFFVGIDGQPIGAEVIDKWFYSETDSGFIGEISAVADPFNKIVWVHSRDALGVKFLVGYHWQLNRWCYADSNVSIMMPLTTPGMTWDGLDSMYPNINAIDEPFDSSLFSGGSPRFAAFTLDNRMGFYTGRPRAARFKTASYELAGSQRGFLRKARAYTDAVDFTIEAGGSDYHGGPTSWSAPATPYAATRLCHFRKSGKLHCFKISIPDSADWSHLTGLEVDAIPEGSR